MSETALFMQARLDSARLPQKALLPLAGRPSLEVAMQGLYGAADRHVLLTTEECRTAFEPLARRQRYDIFSGSKEDVLRRFADAARHYRPEWVIRATGDNTLVGVALAAGLLDLCRRKQADYARFLETPHGSGVEIIRTEALYRAEHEARTPFEREHVCPYIYNNPDRFRVFLPVAPARWRFPALRTTLDTEKDYSYLSQFYDMMYKGKAITLEEFIEWAT
jgi:spore coat polysaccharide biosynthesis protein SpsF